MRTSHATVAAIAALAFGAALPSLATVNHGDFSGTGVDFNAVSETTTTAGDPEPIWDAPTRPGTGTQLFFARRRSSRPARRPAAATSPRRR